VNTDAYYKRIKSLFRPEQLRLKRAIVVGAGSGGSRVATELGRLGLPLTLIDLPGEKLEEHNILRHELGYASLGKSKVEELARHIHNLNPETPITCAELDVAMDRVEFKRLIQSQQPDILIAATDNYESKHILNEDAMAFGLPVVGAGVYDGGIAGECYITRPGGACFACLVTHLQLQDLAPKRSARDIDYSNLELKELQSTAALNLDIAQIALIQSRVVLNLLLDGATDLIGVPPEVNLIVFANRRVPGHFERPLHAEFIHFDRVPDCLVCSSQCASEIDREASRIIGALNS